MAGLWKNDSILEETQGCFVKSPKKEAKTSGSWLLEAV